MQQDCRLSLAALHGESGRKGGETGSKPILEIISRDEQLIHKAMVEWVNCHWIMLLGVNGYGPGHRARGMTYTWLLDNK